MRDNAKGAADQIFGAGHQPVRRVRVLCRAWRIEKLEHLFE